MSVQSKAQDILEAWGKQVSEDLAESLDQALRQGGRKSPQQAALNFRQKVYIEGSGVAVDIIASGEYWKFIESGRKKGARRIPADVVGKEWQNQNNIDARSVILKMRVKNKKGLKVNKQSLNYNKAVRSLSFIIQNSIFKKGIKPKPFIDSVLEDGRIEALASTLRKVLGNEFKLEITNGNNSISNT